MKHPLFAIFIIVICLFSCKEESTPTLEEDYQTEKVIIIVMDGGRYSETWGHPTHQYIPRLSNDLANQGVINTEFYNNGNTFTVSGHSTIATGNYESLQNTGLEYPKHPSIFQLFIGAHQKDTTAAWVIASKGKVEVISNSSEAVWANQNIPATSCGTNGIGSPDRLDPLTFDVAKEVLMTHHPELVLLNFREPDQSGHLNQWNNYLAGIVATDEYIYQIWDFIQTDPFYKGTTTLFVTNDHGRHLDGIADGFKSHGDDCLGCRHIYFYAFGPDFKKNVVLDTHRELPDIAATVAKLLDFHIPKTEGEVMKELFK